MEIVAKGTVTSINVRKEKAGDEIGPTAVDVSMKFLTAEQLLEKLFSTRSCYENLLGAIWRGDGTMATTDLKSMALSVEINGGKGILTPEFSDSEVFEGIEVDKVVLKPQPSRIVEMTCRMVVHPTPAQLLFLDRINQTEVTVSLEPPSVDLVDQARRAEEQRLEEEDTGQHQMSLEPVDDAIFADLETD